MRHHGIKRMLLAPLLAALVVVGGCEKSAGPKPTPTASSAQANACANPYYPVSPSLKRRYTVTYVNSELKPATYVESFNNLAGDSFTLNIEFPDLKTTVQTNWKCTGDGLAALQYANVGAGSMRFTLETVKSSGITFPPADRWRVGEKWEASYDVKTKAGDGPAKQVATDTTGTIVMASEIVGTESVTVPGGTFEAFKVAQTITQKLNVKTPGMTIPVNTDFKSTSWMAKDVGLVKSTIEKTAVTELVSVTK